MKQVFQKWYSVYHKRLELQNLLSVSWDFSISVFVSVLQSQNNSTLKNVFNLFSISMWQSVFEKERDSAKISVYVSWD